MDCSDSIIQLAAKYIELRVGARSLLIMGLESGYRALASLYGFRGIFHNLSNIVLVLLTEGIIHICIIFVEG